MAKKIVFPVKQPTETDNILVRFERPAGARIRAISATTGASIVDVVRSLTDAGLELYEEQKFYE